MNRCVKLSFILLLGIVLPHLSVLGAPKGVGLYNNSPDKVRVIVQEGGLTSLVNKFTGRKNYYEYLVDSKKDVEHSGSATKIWVLPEVAGKTTKRDELIKKAEESKLYRSIEKDNSYFKFDYTNGKPVLIP